MTASDSLLLTACGDIMLHGRYQDLADSGLAASVFDAFAALSADADLIVGNLETPVTAHCQPRDDKLCLRGDPVYARALADARVSLLNLANNHCMDFGAEGLDDTIRHLRHAGVHSIGAGADLRQAGAPVVLESNGLRLGFLAACDPLTKPAPAATASRPGVMPLDTDLLLPAIDALEPDVDHVVLLLHWGLEYSPMPTPEQVAFAHAACDRGVSVILGHHSHCIQGIEHYNGAIIAYSLANLTDDAVDWQGTTRHYQAPLTDVDRESLLLRLRFFRERVETLEPVPLWLAANGRPTLACGDRAAKILTLIAERTEQIRNTRNLNAYWEHSVIERRVSAPLLSWWQDGNLLDKIKRFRPGQIISAWLLLSTYLKVKWSRSSSRWLLFNERNDTRPMPAVRAPKDND